MIAESIAFAILCGVTADVLCTYCSIDGCVKMPLRASIFTYGKMYAENHALF